LRTPRATALSAAYEAFPVAIPTRRRPSAAFSSQSSTRHPGRNKRVAIFCGGRNARFIELEGGIEIGIARGGAAFGFQSRRLSISELPEPSHVSNRFWKSSNRLACTRARVYISPRRAGGFSLMGSLVWEFVRDFAVLPARSFPRGFFGARNRDFVNGRNARPLGHSLFYSQFTALHQLLQWRYQPVTLGVISILFWISFNYVMIVNIIVNFKETCLESLSLRRMLQTEIIRNGRHVSHDEILLLWLGVKKQEERAKERCDINWYSDITISGWSNPYLFARWA